MYVSIEQGEKKNTYLRENEVLDKLRHFGTVQGFDNRIDSEVVFSHTTHGEIITIYHDSEIGEVRVYKDFDDFFSIERPTFIELREVTLKITVDEV